MGMKIIAFVGMPASGKSEAAKAARKKRIPVVVMGDVVRNEAMRRGLEPSDVNIGSVGDQLRAKDGMGAIAKLCVPDIRKLAGTGADRVVVVDGVRGLAEVAIFRREFGDEFTLVSIVAPIEIRLKRISRRRRSDAIKSIESLRARDERELRWGIGDAIESADHVIRNTGAIRTFREAVEVLLDGGKGD